MGIRKIARSVIKEGGKYWRKLINVWGPSPKPELPLKAIELRKSKLPKYVEDDNGELVHEFDFSHKGGDTRNPFRKNRLTKAKELS